MKIGHFFLVFCGALMMLSSCEDPYENLNNVESKDTLIPNDYDLSSGVTESEANTVAHNFMDNISPLGRSASSKIECINDKFNNPAFYIVNFGVNDGFVIISASHDVSPVLAYSDKGHFDIELSDSSPVSIWMDSAKEYVSNSDTISVADKNYALTEWLKYLPNTHVSSSKNYKTDSRADYNGYDIDAIKQAAFDEWNQKGWYVYSNVPIEGVNTMSYYSFPRSVQDILDEISSDNSSYFMTGRPLIEDTYVVGWSETDSRETKPLLKTVWGQDAPFNEYLKTIYPNSQYLGCTAVALGQILNYRRDLPGYNYDLMPTTGIYPDPTGIMEVGRFLYDIGSRIGIKYKDGKTSAQFNDVKNALSKYGYTYSIPSFAPISLAERLTYNSGPVFISAQGKDLSSGKSTGHAWVCDGAYYQRTIKYYMVMIPNPTPEDVGTGPYFTYNRMWPALKDESISYSLHFNWGYSGMYDGYFRGSVFNANGAQFYKDFQLISNISK